MHAFIGWNASIRTSMLDTPCEREKDLIRLHPSSLNDCSLSFFLASNNRCRCLKAITSIYDKQSVYDRSFCARSRTKTSLLINTGINMRSDIPFPWISETDDERLIMSCFTALKVSLSHVFKSLVRFMPFLHQTGPCQSRQPC
jgi:hypothetical protein